MAVTTIPANTYKLGFIGAGKLAESIARGFVKSGTLPAYGILTAHSRQERRAVFQSFGVSVVVHNSQVIQDTDVVILSVKPQTVKRVALELKPLLQHRHLLVFVAAGVRLKDLQGLPNTPAAVGKAASVISRGSVATENDVELVAKLFGAIDKVWKAEEKLLDAVTGLSGSGPAYIYLAIEALADGGVAAGLPRDIALGLASQTVLGAATMVINKGKHPAQLKDDVASPGGTTIAGIHELEKAGFRGTLITAVVAAAKHGQQLSPK